MELAGLAVILIAIVGWVLGTITDGFRKATGGLDRANARIAEEAKARDEESRRQTAELLK